MTLPLHLFGGWLQLFYLSIWMGIALSVYSCFNIIYAFVTYQSMESRIMNLTLLFEQIIVLILFLKMLRIVKTKEANIPEKVVRLLTWLVMFVLGFCILESIIANLFFPATSSKFIEEIGGNIGRVLFLGRFGQIILCDLKELLYIMGKALQDYLNSN